MKFLITISALCIIASAAVMAIPAWENSLGVIGGVIGAVGGIVGSVLFVLLAVAALIGAVLCFALYALPFCLVLALYFLPSIIARNHEHAGAICVLNLFTGWSVVGWVAAFIWARTSPTLASPASVAEWSFNNEIPICRKLEGRIFKD